MSVRLNNFEFEGFVLDSREKVLLRDGKPVAVTPKVFQLLFVLVQNHGHLVEKDDLMRLVWTDSFVEEGNIAFNIGLLRKLLGDDKKTPRFIETVPKRGYRFIANVKQIAVEDVEAVYYAQQTKVQLNANIFSRNHVLFALLAVAVIGMSVTAYFYRGFGLASRADGVRSIAVLPLKPIDAANRDDIVEVGVADSIIRKLGSMKGLIVRPLSAVRRYGDIEEDSLAAGREQQVDYVLASSYQLANGRFRVTSQLINVQNGKPEENYTSEKELKDLFSVQDSIADDIGNMLSARFAGTFTAPPSRRGTTNEDAYRLYLAGMYLYDKRTPADAQKAVTLLQRAIQLDPNFARAWAGKAHVHRALGNFSNHTHAEYKNSIEAINKALALDENLSDAHSALCENKYFYERDFEGAQVECKRAIELDPNSALAHQIYSRNLMVLGHFDESIAEIKTAIDLEPTSLFSQRNFGIAFYYARRYKEAVNQFKRVTEMDPNFEATYPWLINTLQLLGNDAESFDWFLKWQTVQKADEQTIKAYKTAYQTAGWQGVGRERTARFDENKIRSYFMEACMAAQAGNFDEAFAYLDSSYRRREWGMAFIRFEPALDDLRGSPSFDDLPARVDQNLPEVP